MLLIYDDPEQWRDIGTTGGAQLQPTDTARSVRVENGRTIVTDGPFAETKEYLGGFYLIEADSAAAAAIADRIPSARLGGTVEVCPVVR